MKLIICGPGARGKTEFVKILKKELNLKLIVQYTSRPPRQGEIQNVDYIFNTDKNFYENTNFVELQHFEYIDWYYGTTPEQWDAGDMLVVNPKSLDQIKSYALEHNEDILVVYFDISKYTIIKRLQERDDSSTTVVDRLESDFKNFEYFNDYDIKIKDSEFNTKLEKIIKLIKK